MLHEFALDPHLLNNWNAFRLYVHQFGFDQGRLIVEFPRKWKRMVMENLSLGECKDIEKLRIQEALRRLDDRMVRRPGSQWDPGQTWLENAENEHSRIPFRAIIAEANERSHVVVLTGESLDNTLEVSTLPDADPRHLWKVDRSQTIKRTAPVMADAIHAFLIHADQLWFVDKHFGPENLRYRSPFQEFFSRLLDRPDGVMPKSIEVHCAKKSEFTFFYQQCEQHLASSIPAGVQVHFYRWADKDLHNRYVLTELGGVAFHEGLDQYTGSGREEDVVSLLDLSVVRQLIQDYSKGESRFSLQDECVITGTCQRRRSQQVQR